ncbi:DUF1697 domain-containing protein [Streptomyces sp. NPDC048717]|uniref:DUF1697 domain-containing protein n=1 Tax=Streptomyces sp. NPDC048717 TaxID=3154928 RepID=UPI00342A9843
MTTTTWAALLRGINVSGRNRVPMAELVSVLEGLGHTGVRTYLQSGNAVFTTDRATAGGGGGADTGSVAAAEEELAAELETAIERHFGFTVPCLVRDHAYLAAVERACPFPAAELEGKQLHAFYCSGPLDADRFVALDPAVFAPEAFALGDRALYLYTPEGLGRSKLGDALGRPAFFKGLTVTARNWNTVRKLVGMTAGA